MSRKRKSLHSFLTVSAFYFLLLPFQYANATGVKAAGTPTREIRLSGTNDTKNSYHGRWLTLIYSEAFKRLGLGFKYDGYPAKRSSHISDSAKSDGEIHRVFDYGDKHPNLIRVNEPHFAIRFSAYTNNPSLKLLGWDSLKGKDYRVGYRVGVKKTESELPNLVREEKLSRVVGAIQGLRMLNKDRLDLFIDVESIIENNLQSDDTLKLSKIHRAGIMEDVTAHAYLHIKNRSLIPKLNHVLQEMKKEGLIEKYAKTAEK